MRLSIVPRNLAFLPMCHLRRASGIRLPLLLPQRHSPCAPFPAALRKLWRWSSPFFVLGIYKQFIDLLCLIIDKFTFPTPLYVRKSFNFSISSCSPNSTETQSVSSSSLTSASPQSGHTVIPSRYSFYISDTMPYANTILNIRNTLFCTQIFINTLGSSLSCSHCQNYGSCSCYRISTGIDTFLGGFAVISSAIMHFHLLVSSPLVVEEIRGFGEVPNDMITVSNSITNSDPGTSTGRRLPLSSARPVPYGCTSCRSPIPYRRTGFL